MQWPDRFEKETNCNSRNEKKYNLEKELNGMAKEPYRHSWRENYEECWLEKKTKTEKESQMPENFAGLLKCTPPIQKTNTSLSR